MKKVVLFLMLCISVLISSFTLEQNVVADGRYEGNLSKKANAQSNTASNGTRGGFNNQQTVMPDNKSDDVVVTIRGNRIIAITGFRYAYPEKMFLNQIVKLDKKGNFSLEVEQFEKDATNRNDPGYTYKYKLKISKKSFLENLDESK